MKYLLLIMLFVASIVSGQISATNVYISNGISISQAPIASAWTFDTETQTITAYDGSLGADVTVPETISGLQVLHIGDSACENKGISTIALPEGLLTIAAEAFKDNSITAATAPSTLTSIGANAFNGNYITSWWLPDGVTLPNTFYGMSQYYGSALYSLYYKEGQIGGHFSSYQSVGGYPWIRHDISPTHLAAYTIAGDTITGYNVAVGGTVAVLPFKKDGITVTKIGDDDPWTPSQPFAGKGLTGLRFPTQTYGGQFPGGGQYTFIGYGSFVNHAISIIQLPSTLTHVGLNAFAIGDAVSAGATMVAVSNSPNYLAGTFSSNRNLTSVSWLMGVPTIPTLMFGACHALSEILLHYGAVNDYYASGVGNYGFVQSIGEGAFAWTNITQVTLPDSCTSVARTAFATFAGMSRVTLPANVAIADETSFNDIYTMSQASFKAAYEAGGSLAGTYEYSGGAWIKTH